ncbi:MAG: GNAT family N-acetyltransferase [Gemmatimonadota bacterium]
MTVASDVLFDEANRSDLDRLVALLGVLFEQEADFEPDPAKQRRGLELLLKNPTRGRVFVARKSGQTAAAVTLQFAISTVEGGETAWVEDVIVDPRHRGAGIGRGLLAYAIDWARRRGIPRLTLLTDAGNEPAQKLYRSFGFTGSAMVPLRLYLR